MRATLAGAVVAALVVMSSCASANQAAETVTSIVTEAQEGAATTTTPPTTEAPTTQPAADADPAVEELYPDILAAEVTEASGGGFTVSATMSSPYDTPARYADAFRVLTVDGVELGVRVLTHDHANEQPFTRSLNGLEIPDDVSEVIVEGRDQVSGWGGATVLVAVPGR